MQQPFTAVPQSILLTARAVAATLPNLAVCPFPPAACDIRMTLSFGLNQSAARYIEHAAFFICVLFLPHQVHAASTVTFYGVTKAQRFAQTNANPPTILSAAGFRAEAFVFSSST